ncbi:lambda exonuclease family protein [Paenarthrobacter nicotinovorans]|uniref:lambda exonuclease family protein n=1 Tax=Paenarthrobacter nicotinovorans TaxID=29320 RepID=UPI003804951E
MTATITEHQQQQPGNLHVYNTLVQGTDEWLQARCGILTASVIGQLITPKTVKPASNDYSRALTTSLVAERITNHVEPIYVSADMERGTLDEPYARDIYSEHYAPAHEVGFMVRDFGWGKVGFSPDGLVGEDGLIEIKSRRQKKQLSTILADEVPLENMAQIQTGLLVSGREWLDYISYCGGMPLYVKRVLPDPKWFEAIHDAARIFEATADVMIANYQQQTTNLPPTTRIDHYPDLELKF